MRSRTSLGRYLEAFVDQAPLDGVERELNEFRGLSTGGNVLPWDALLPAEGMADVEHRADAVSPGPASGNPTNQAQIIQRVFARAATRRLGVAMPVVPVGVASYPVISTGQTAQFVAEDAAKEAAEGAITPHRVLAGPGCFPAGKQRYLDKHRQPTGVVIDVGEFYRMLGGREDIPSRDPIAGR